MPLGPELDIPFPDPTPPAPEMTIHQFQAEVFLEGKVDRFMREISGKYYDTVQDFVSVTPPISPEETQAAYFEETALDPYENAHAKTNTQ